MTQTVGLLGATGVYAWHLIPRLLAAGFAVQALVRRPEAAGVARGCGADIRSADIFDEASLRRGLEGCDIGINLATSLPGPSGSRGDFDANDRLRSEGTPLWISAAIQAGVTRVVQQSIAMVNASAEQWADEDTVFAGAPNEVANRAVAAAISMEESVRRTDIDWIILARGIVLYGCRRCSTGHPGGRSSSPTMNRSAGGNCSRMLPTWPTLCLRAAVDVWDSRRFGFATTWLGSC